MTKSKIKPLPLYCYTIPLSVIVILGIADSVYLAVSHYKNYTDITYQSFCALTKAVNCDTVSQSTYSIFLNVPVPIWAFIAYTFYFIVLISAWRTRINNQYWAMLCIIGLGFTGYSFYLAYISAIVIKSYCIMCIGLYGVNLLATFYPWLIFNRFCESSFLNSLKQDVINLFSSKVWQSAFLTCGLIVISMIFWFPKYWQYEYPEIDASISTGMTENFSPWIGAKEDPEIIIHEYSDYLCFQCGKMHHYLRHLVNKYPEKIRLVHHNYPLDHSFNPVLVDKPFHRGAGKLALISIHASFKGNFWEINDRLFKVRLQPVMGLEHLSQFLEIDRKELTFALSNKAYRRKLDVDIKTGLKSRIVGTPSYIINQKVYEGYIPLELFHNLKE